MSQSTKPGTRVIEFFPSNPLTVGLELELQLVDADTLDLADGILPLLELYPDNPYIKAEFIQETVEVASKPCADCWEFEAHLNEVVGALVDDAARLGLRLCGAGTHPFSTRFAAITPFARYLQIEEKSAYLSHTRVTYATHVHVGVAHADEMIRLCRELVAYLPIFVALSANSPFWHGCDTGFASYRQRALAATGNYGIPPRFEDWGDFQTFFGAAKRAGMARQVKDFHWDVRPQPGFGTVELRTMDAVRTVEEAVGLAALARALVAYLQHTSPEERPAELPHELPHWAHKENHFRASQAALDAECVVDRDGRLRPVREQVEAVLAAVRPVAQELGEEYLLERIRRTLRDGPGSARQRSIYAQTGSLGRVEQALVDELDQPRRRHPPQRLR